MQRKPLTAEVLNFTKGPGEKVLTNYHRKSLFKDNVRWHQIYKDEYCLFYSAFSFYKNLCCCLYCCRWPTFPRKENDSRSEENISKRMSVQLAILKILKLKLGSEAWGNKTKEIISRLGDEWCISPPLLPQPRSHVRILIHWKEPMNDLSVSRNADKCLFTQLPAFTESLFCFFPFIRLYLTQSCYKS